MHLEEEVHALEFEYSTLQKRLKGQTEEVERLQMSYEETLKFLFACMEDIKNEIGTTENGEGKETADVKVRSTLYIEPTPSCQHTANLQFI